MPRVARPEIREKDMTGLKYFDRLAPLLERLHDDACDRDSAGNRILHCDQYCMLLLLHFFNPIVDSLRGIQQASELRNVQKKRRAGKLSGTNNRWFLRAFCCPSRGGSTMLLRQIDGPLFVFLLVSEDTAKDSTSGTHCSFR